MSKCRVYKLAIAIVGGNGRAHSIRVAAEIRSYPSSLDGGNGSIRRVIAAIKSGKIQLVLLLVRWIGHSEYDAVVKACKAAGVLWLNVPAGPVRAYQQQVQEYLDGRRNRELLEPPWSR